MRDRSRGRVPAGGVIQTMVTRRGVRVPVPERSRRRGEEGTGVDASADDHQPPDPICERFGMEDKRYTMHSFWAGGAASQNMDGTSMIVLLEHLWWEPATVARIWGNSVRGSGGREAFSPNGDHLGGRPAAARAVCRSIHSVPTGQAEPSPLRRGQGIHRCLGCHHDDRKPELTII